MLNVMVDRLVGKLAGRAPDDDALVYMMVET
jgi:hypothetical protein